jgi:phosphopantothenoylcysteine decarboxylase/phosphopantothenate--cysteine ligase
MKGKKILLGVCGSIAAYKSAFLLRSLIKEGVQVKCILTKDASQFVGEITFSTLSKNEVITDLNLNGNWNNHVELGLWADAMIIAPATLNTIGKAANGICDNALLSVYFSAKCPVFWAPSMDLDMWKHPANASNLQKLESYSNQIIPVGNGELASGLHGEGRMAEPDTIISFLKNTL